MRELPPAYTFVGDIEPFYCETLTHIESLKAVGVEASVDVYPNVPCRIVGVTVGQSPGYY